MRDNDRGVGVRWSALGLMAVFLVPVRVCRACRLVLCLEYAGA